MAGIGLADVRFFINHFVPPVSVALLSWVLCSFGFSFFWLIFAVGIYCCKITFNTDKDVRHMFAKRLFLQEKKTVNEALSEVPKWVYFPDVERVEWLNRMMQQIWPHVTVYAKQFIKGSVEPKIRDALTEKFGSFVFNSIDLGDMPFRVGGVKVYQQSAANGEIVMDADVFYAGDACLSAQLAKLTAGIKDLQIHGTVRIVFGPILNTPPFVGAIKVYFVANPLVNFNLTNAAAIFDIPGLYVLLRSIVSQQIADLMVLPNVMTFCLTDRIDRDVLQVIEPKGVLRVKIERAEGLQSKDVASKSDPYIKIMVGAVQHETSKKTNTDAPIWNEYFEFPVMETHGQCIEMLLLDHDEASKDDELGIVTVPLLPVVEAGFLDTWLSIDGGEGSVKVMCTWLSLTRNRQLGEGAQLNAGIRSSSLSTAVVSVFADSAKNLESIKNYLSEPSSQTAITIGSKTFRTRAVANARDPLMGDNFHFLVRDCNIENLIVKVRDVKSEETLGSVTVPLSQVLDAPNMILYQPFALKEHGGSSEIKLRIAVQMYLVPALERPEVSKSSVSHDVMTRLTSLGSSGDNASLEVSQSVAEFTSAGNSVETESVFSAASSTPDLRQRTSSALRDSRVFGEEAGLGRIQISLRYSQQRSKLIVTILKCLDLACDEEADPFVRAKILDSASHKTNYGTKETKVKKNDRNPAFEEMLEFPVKKEEIAGGFLDIAVKNHVSLFSRPILGKVCVPLDNLDTPLVNLWYYLQPDGGD